MTLFSEGGGEGEECEGYIYYMLPSHTESTLIMPKKRKQTSVRNRLITLTCGQQSPKLDNSL